MRPTCHGPAYLLLIKAVCLEDEGSPAAPLQESTSQLAILTARIQQECQARPGRDWPVTAAILKSWDVQSSWEVQSAVDV